MSKETPFASVVLKNVVKTWNFLSSSLETSAEAWTGGGIATGIGQGIKYAVQATGYKPSFATNVVLNHLIPDACGAAGFAGVGQIFYFNHKAEENKSTPAEYINDTGETRKEIFLKFAIVGGVAFVVYTITADMMPWLQFKAVVNGVNLRSVVNGVAAVGGGLTEFAALAYPIMGDFPLPKLLDIAGVFAGFNIGEQVIAPLLPDPIKPLAPAITAGVASFAVNMAVRGISFFCSAREGQKQDLTGNIQEEKQVLLSSSSSSLSHGGKED